jgi:hypothetical protein
MSRGGLRSMRSLTCMVFSLCVAPAFAFGAPEQEKLTLGYRQLTPLGGEEVSLVFDVAPSLVRFSRNSNFDQPSRSVVRLGLFEAKNDPVVLGELQSIRAASRRLLFAKKRLHSSKNQAGPGAKLNPHGRVSLLNDEPLVDESSPQAQILKDAFFLILLQAQWLPVDAVELKREGMGAKSSPKWSVHSLTRRSKTLRLKPECREIGRNLSGNTEWRCEVDGYGAAHFVLNGEKR